MEQAQRQAMDRWIAFWKREMPGEILAQVRARQPSSQPSRWIAYVKENGLETEKLGSRPPMFENLDRMLEIYEVRASGGWPERRVRDDTVQFQSFCPTVNFGEGISGALFGGRIRFASSDVKTESVSDPVITDWSQLDGLGFDAGNEWVQRIVGVLRHFVENGNGGYCLHPYCTIDGLNFAVVLRGATQAFVDVIEHEAPLRRLFDLGYETSVGLWNLQRAVVEGHNRAVIQHDEYAELCQCHAVPGLSIDAYSLCAPEVYDRIGLEYTQKLIDTYGGGDLHIHSLGHHLIPGAGKVRGLTQLKLADDPHCDRGFEKLDWARAHTGDTPLTVRCTLEEFERGLRSGSLPGGVAYTVQGAVDSVDEANRLMDRVRSYRVSG